MALSLFGVTHTTVRTHCFPRLDAWSSTSTPTSTTVGSLIDVAAARVAAALAKEDISAATVHALGSADPAYVICADVVRKMTALALNIPTDDPDARAQWQKELDAFFKQLAEDAGIALANSSLTSAESDPNGPTTHLTEYDLDVDDETDMSDATFPLHAKDAL